MTEKFRFFDALTYGVRTLFWRPMRVLLLLATLSLLAIAYYMWAQSDAGMAFFTGYMESTLAVSQGNFSNPGGGFGLIMGASLISGSVVIAAALRVYVRDQPVLRLPVQFGTDEVRTLGLYLVMMALMMALWMIVMIGVVILVMVVVMAFGPGFAGGGDAAAGPEPATIYAAAIAGVLVAIPILLAFGYVCGRVAVSFALTIRDRKFSLGGWKASKGAGMQLMFAHFILYGLLVATQFLFAPGIMETAFSGMAHPGVMPDPAVMAAAMANPYGDWMMLAVPVQLVLTFLLFGPIAAVANWDARKREAAEIAAVPAPAVDPA